MDINRIKDREEPLISVVVPIYGIERYLGLCIESLMRQTYENLEIILVDDGSPDRCPEICDLYAQKDERIKVVHKKNGGLVSARKAGLAASRGEYIGYVDGDDWVGPGFYEALYTEMRVSDADIVTAGFCRDLFDKSVNFHDNLPMGIYEKKRLHWLWENMLSYGKFYRPGITTYVWNKLFRRELLLECQMDVDERITIGEDAAVTYPALLKSRRVSVTDNMAYHYRQREDSMLKKTSSFEAEAEKLKYLYEYMIAYAKKNGVEILLQKQINDYILANCIMRSGGRIPHEFYCEKLSVDAGFSVFGKKYYGKDVILYLAGTFGQQLMNRIREGNLCNVICWVDEDYWEYRRCCMNVDPINSIVKSKFDYILVATVDGQKAEQDVRLLMNYGISRTKILTVNCSDQIHEKLIQSYLYGEMK